MEMTQLCWAAVAKAAAAILSIIIPMRNERDNIQPLLALLTTALPYTAWEAIYPSYPAI
jgi:hypothetical protein